MSLTGMVTECLAKRTSNKIYQEARNLFSHVLGIKGALPRLYTQNAIFEALAARRLGQVDQFIKASEKLGNNKVVENVAQLAELVPDGAPGDLDFYANMFTVVKTFMRGSLVSLKDFRANLGTSIQKELARTAELLQRPFRKPSLPENMSEYITKLQTDEAHLSRQGKRLRQISRQYGLC